MCSMHSSVVTVESAHDALPHTASTFKLFAFPWELLTDIFASKNVLDDHKAEKLQSLTFTTAVKQNYDARPWRVCQWSTHIQPLTYLQINPLTLHSEDHFNHFQHKWQPPLPTIHLLLKSSDKVRCLHRGQNNLVVFQSLENLLSSPKNWQLMNISNDLQATLQYIILYYIRCFHILTCNSPTIHGIGQDHKTE